MRNPKFVFSLTDPDLSDDKTRAALVLSLAQRVAERKTEHAIGFRVYRVRAVLDITADIRAVKAQICSSGLLGYQALLRIAGSSSIDIKCLILLFSLSPGLARWTPGSPAVTSRWARLTSMLTCER